MIKGLNLNEIVLKTNLKTQKTINDLQRAKKVNLLFPLTFLFIIHDIVLDKLGPFQNQTLHSYRFAQLE